MVFTFSFFTFSNCVGVTMWAHIYGIQTATAIVGKSHCWRAIKRMYEMLLEMGVVHSNTK